MPTYVHTGGPAITPNSGGPVTVGDRVELGVKAAAEYVAHGILRLVEDNPAEPEATPTDPAVAGEPEEK